ncbi:gluconate 2-dehydrogenase subunit 3 family protein [Haloarcula salinisoli]|uniref:Gluconate 2-dehydrogenase subunit 3 family protein n=1 Tax=Haloarcula salinisoli TaxID=2487746 RepID=A0A8J8CC73_9EURY|nr:gluconate 2-dehydrogenase subunit 3 family protein [Halomicroarcula salinisoli]MBX0285392.1 gluconate 2-dehydrogenase subunit 3 family protein [Halomicroarcula salinisoli]MBX0303130.1 gluconate 2-dehydrogenase subunit 3 family protein [Halomicroarcula salinisoli]
MRELDRRDVLTALGAAGITVGGGAALLEWADDEDGEPLVTDHQRRTLHAVATTVYPSEVSGVESFVDGYMSRRLRADTDRADSVIDALSELNSYALDWEDATFPDLTAQKRDETLRAMGVAEADPIPDGAARERVRYYLVNELVYGLYSSPTGGELVGIENPQGYPGGTESYQQPPDGR